MARSLETIITELKEVYPTIKINDEILSTEVYNSTISFWAEDIRNQELDEEANGYKVARQSAYSSIQDQLDMMYWDGVNGTTTWADHIAQVKSDNPKPV